MGSIRILLRTVNLVDRNADSGACRSNASQLDAVVRHCSLLPGLRPREPVADTAIIFLHQFRVVQLRRRQRLDVQRRGSNVVCKVIRVAKDMTVNDLVLLLNALCAVSPQRNGRIAGLPGITIGVNRSQTGGGVPCTHPTICDILREILLRQVAEVCRNRVARRGQHILICKHILICANRAEHLDTVNRRCFHLRLVDRQCSRDRAIIHRTARVRYRQLVDAAVRLVPRRVGRDGIRHGGRLNAVRNACRCRDDQLLQIIAVDLGGMVVLINGHGLRAKPEGDFPVAEDRIIRKVFQRDLVFCAIVPMAHQSDIDIRCRQHRHILRRRSFPCRRRGILKQTDSTNRQCNSLACCVCRKACRQLERTASHTGAVRLCAVQLRVPLSLSLLVRDKAQIGQHLLAVNEHPALVVQRAVVVRDGDVEGTVIVLPERNVKGVVQCTGCRLAVLHAAVIGADVLVHRVELTSRDLDIVLQIAAAVVADNLSPSVRHVIDHTADNLLHTVYGTGHNTVIVNHSIIVIKIIIQRCSGAFIIRILIDIQIVQTRTDHSGVNIMICCAVIPLTVCQHARIANTRFTLPIAGITVIGDFFIRASAARQQPVVINIVVVACIICTDRRRIAAVCKRNDCLIRPCCHGQTVLYIGILHRALRRAVFVAVAENTGNIVIAVQYLRIVAAAIDVQNNILGCLADLRTGGTVALIAADTVGREKADNAGGHGVGINLYARTVYAIHHVDGIRLTAAIIGAVRRDIAENTRTVVCAVALVFAVAAVQTAVVLTTDDIEILTGGRMVHLRYNTAGRADPADYQRGLQIAVVVAVLNRTAVIGPLADDTARIVRLIAVHRAIVDTVFDRPVGCGLVGLCADDTACKSAGRAVCQLAADKRLIEQIGQVLFALVHADNTAGADTDAVRLVDQQPAAADAAIQLTGRRIVARHAAKVAVARYDDLHGAVCRYALAAAVVGQLFHIRPVCPLYPGGIRRQLLCLGIRQQLAHLADIFHQGFGALIAGHGDRALVIAGHTADHAVFDRDRAGSGIVYVALLDDAGRIILACNAADMRGQAFLLCRRAGGGCGVHTVRRQCQPGNGAALQQTAVQSGNAAVAVADRTLSFIDRAGVSAFGYLAACIILTDYTAEIGILREFLEIRGDLHLADRTARSIDADCTADLQRACGNAVCRLLRNLGCSDRTAVVSDNSTQNECTAGNRDMIAECRSLNRATLVVYRTDRACRSLVAGDERYPVIRADAAAPDRTVVFAGNAACIAVVTGDTAVADTVLDRAARAVHADNAACRTDIRGHLTEILRVPQNSLCAPLRADNAACTARRCADLCRLIGQAVDARAAEYAAVDADNTADHTAAAHGQPVIRGNDIALHAAACRTERAGCGIHADHAADTAATSVDTALSCRCARKRNRTAVFARNTADTACTADIGTAGVVLYPAAAEIIADDAADRVPSGDGAVFLGRAVFNRARRPAADIQTRDTADIILRCAAHAAGERAVADDALVQTDHAAHGIQTVHRALAGTVVYHLILTVDADHTADNGNTQFAAAQLIGERLRGIRVLLRLQIGYHIHTGFQLTVREGVICRTVKAACVQAVLHLHLGLRLTAADNAACIRIRADGHVIGNRRQPACTVAVRCDGDGMRIGRCLDRSRHIAVVCRDARQKRIQRSACPVFLRVGALIADQTAAECLCSNRAKAVIDLETADRDILSRVDHICTDRTADIVPSLHTARLDGQLLLEQLCRSIQTDQTADAVSGCGNTAADERIIDINRAVRVVIADQTADIVSADNDTRHTPVGDCVILVAEGDRAAVVAGQTARIAADGSPVCDTPVDRIIGVRNIACTVYDGRIVLICTANTADKYIVSCNDTCVDAVFDRRTAFILTDDAADIRIADDIACVNGCSGAVFTEQCRLRIRLIQRTDDAADILAAENVAVCLGLAVIQHTLFAVADNAADISAAQLVSILLLIGVAVRISGTASAFGKRRVMRVTDNAADIMSCQRMIICGCAAEKQPLIFAVRHIFSRGLILAGKIACNAANRAIARYSSAVGEGLDCGTVCCQAARNTADTTRSTAGRQRTGYSTRCRQLDY